MAGAVFVFATASGFIYLRSLDLHHVSPVVVWAAWIILCADNAFGIWGTVWNCLLQGIGYVGWDAIIASFVSASTITVQIVAVFLGGRLITLGDGRHSGGHHPATAPAGAGATTEAGTVRAARPLEPGP